MSEGITFDAELVIVLVDWKIPAVCANAGFAKAKLTNCSFTQQDDSLDC